MQSIRRPHRAVVDKNQPSRLDAQAIKEMIANLSGRVADIGCGNSRNALAFADAGCTVYCLDNKATGHYAKYTASGTYTGYVPSPDKVYVEWEGRMQPR
jgi:hypothetical protein